MLGVLHWGLDVCVMDGWMGSVPTQPTLPTDRPIYPTYHGASDGGAGVVAAGRGGGPQGGFAEAHEEAAHPPEEHVVAGWVLVGVGAGEGRYQWRVFSSVRSFATTTYPYKQDPHIKRLSLPSNKSKQTHPLALARKAACVSRGSVRCR